MSPEAYRPDALIAWLSKRYFSRIAVDPAWVKASRHDAAVVHVLRSRSYLDFLAIDYLLKQASLCPLRFVADTGLWLFEPFGIGVARLLGRSEPETTRLAKVITDGHSALLFMGPSRAPRSSSEADHIGVLLALARSTERRVVLVPQVLVWGKSPGSREQTLIDQLFGPTDKPGRLRVAARFLRNYNRALLRAGDALDLGAMIRESPGDTDAELARKVHWVLFRRLERERRVALGPVQKTPDRVAVEVLRTPRVQRTLDELSTRSGRARALIEAEALKELLRLGARPDPWVIELLDRAFVRVIRRIFDAVVVDSSGFERIREAARRGPVVLLPSHRSHLDYMLLSWACYHHGLSTPLIAAGDNLAFWPLGAVLRRGGAFFIRRTVQGESARVYSVLLDGYVRKVLREGYIIEFFFEGARSRTGRVLPARLGLLSLVVDAAAAGGEAVSFVPVSIAYDRVVEGRSYVAELLGAPKQPEDVEGLLEVPAVLASRYGCAYINVGEITTKQPEYTVEKGVLESTSQGRKAERDRLVSRRGELNLLAKSLVGEIHRVTPVTPSALLALALLSHPGRGLTRVELDATAARLLTLLNESGAPVAPTLAVLSRGLERGIELLRDGGLLSSEGVGPDAVYVVPDERRLALDYYKNNLLHLVAGHSVLASGLVAGGGVRVRGRSVARAEVLATAQKIARLFHHEFAHAIELDASIEGCLEGLIARGEVIARADGTLTAPDDDSALWLSLLAGALRNYLESYRIAARALVSLVGGAMPLKQLVTKGLSLGKKMFLAGELSRREAISKQNIENALGAFRAMGYLGGGDGGPQRLKSPYDTYEGARLIEAQIAAMLP